jgi:hypothetical protein
MRIPNVNPHIFPSLLGIPNVQCEYAEQTALMARRAPVGTARFSRHL